MNEIQVLPHTIVLLVGPTNSGKSEWVESMADNLDNDFVLVSSDSIRRSLLGDQKAHKYDPRMLEVSGQAFDLLLTTLASLTEYPVNAPCVIVDTRGMSDNFRDKVRDIAQRNHYHVDCVLFDYKDIQEYIGGLTDEEGINFTRYDVKRFRREVLPVVRSKDYHKVHRIKSRAALRNTTLAPVRDHRIFKFKLEGKRLAVIGDVHECVDEFNDLYGKIMELEGDTTVVQLGDWIDKGNNTEAAVACMEGFLANGGYIIHGNHEAYVYHRLFAETSVCIPQEFEDKFFGSIKVLQRNPELANRFKFIYERSLPFMEFSSPDQRTVFVTHSPCEEKYLGKLTPEARRNQRNLQFRKGIDPETFDVRESIPFVFSEASITKPLHVFGHLAHACAKKMFKNKVFLDTGCVNGGKLTAFLLHNGRYDFLQVEGGEGKPDFGDVLTTTLTQPIVEKREFNIKDYDLTPDEQKFVRRTVRNGVKYISGTMSPSPSTDTELEPLSSALTYFKNRGVKRVALEPKHMGSRCQVYLHKNEPEKDFCVSRNGYVIKHVDGLDKAVAELRTKMNEFLSVYAWNDQAIVDCELMPWSALGSGLIEYQFKSYGGLVRNELTTLSTDSAFAKFDIAKALDVNTRLNTLLPIFDETLSIYAGTSELSLKPFNVLSVDGTTDVILPGLTSQEIADEQVMFVDLDDYSEQEVNRFFDSIATGRKMEGVVVKPAMFYSELPPKTPEYMKVRNERYLTLVYGYDYQMKYDRLLRQKNISGKVAVSIRESKLGHNMLKSTTEAELLENVVKMTSELKREKELDPRL